MYFVTNCVSFERYLPLENGPSSSSNDVIIMMMILKHYVTQNSITYPSVSTVSVTGEECLE